MTKSKYFPSQTNDHYVEIVETATGKVEKRMGPMSESKADKVEMGVLHRINLERFCAHGDLCGAEEGSG